MQSKKYSIIESLAGTAIGFIISLIVWHWVAKWYGIPMPIGTNLEITGIFTVVSIARGYIVRRLFNKIKNDFNLSRTIREACGTVGRAGSVRRTPHHIR